MNLWSYVRFIFSRPVLAAGVVGTSIHLLMALNQRILLNISYWGNISGHVRMQPIYGAFQILIPFLVPYLVTVVGRKLRVETELHSLEKFPQANPNLVMKLDGAAHVQFMNNATEILLNEIGLQKAEVNTILPEDTDQIVAEIIGTDRTINRKAKIRDCTFEFLFSAFADDNSVFLSGRNVTEQLELETEVQDSYQHLTELTDFADRTFTRFDALSFDSSRHYHSIMQLLLREETEEHYDKPTYIFLALKRTDGRMVGHIFTKHEGQLIEDEEELIVDPKQADVAINYGENQVVWSNYDNEKGTLEEYQAQFHERVRAKLGTIEAFVTFTSGELALIGFYKNRKVNNFDAQVLKSLTIHAKSLKLVADQAQATEAAFSYAIEALARAAEANDEDTGEHIIRVNKYSKSIAEALGMDAEFVRKINYTAQMHDVGKVHIPPSILRKPGKLTKADFDLMSQHPEIGARILGDSPRLEMARNIALAHHEKYDGSGYPNGLKGEDIPLAARIVTIADVYDALRQKRSYKPSFSHKKAFDIITRGDGRVSPEHFDPKILEAFVKIEHEIKAIYETHQK